jgi:hypothetical protein
MKRTFAIFAAVPVALTLLTSASARVVGWGDGGPSTATPGVGAPSRESSDLGELIYQTAQTLADRAGIVDHDRPIIVTTIVSIDDLTKSSTFGRLASELISDRLAQRGYLVRDVTYTRALTFAPGTGEIVLSQDARGAASSVNAQAVVAGTYAVGGREIYLNVRLLNAATGELLSTADAVVPLDHNTEALVGVLTQR